MRLITWLLPLIATGTNCSSNILAFSPPAFHAREGVVNWQQSKFSSTKLYSTQPPKIGTENASLTTTSSSRFPSTSSTRGKVNEIDFCMAPSDVSLSRAYAKRGGSSSADILFNEKEEDDTEDEEAVKVSLTRALNNVSNRAVQRILLSRAWPSAEALNLSLRRALASQPSLNVDPAKGDNSESTATATAADDSSSAKCPVPRPILNILTKRGQDADSISTSSPMKRTEEQWVSDQIDSFRSTYGTLPGYALAEAYLECVLSLATSGTESPKLSEVLAAGVYAEPYRRLIGVLKSAGAEFVEVADSTPSLTKIAPKLIDQNFCLSILDTISLDNEKLAALEETTEDEEAEEEIDSTVQVEEEVEDDEEISMVTPETEEEPEQKEEEPEQKEAKSFKWFGFFRRKKVDVVEVVAEEISEDETTESENDEESEEDEEEDEIKKEDLGGVLLSSEEPSMTRQLNALSNIVGRSLLFGGDQELLVLYETLEADKPAFLQRWYPETVALPSEEEDKSGVQYFNCLLQLLKDSFTKGVIDDLDPPFPLNQCYSGAYERLTASLVELGSGYIKPSNNKKTASALPKTAKEEFDRFAQWEVAFRQTVPDIDAYPEDIVGDYKVIDEVQGKTIGVSNVTLAPQGVVEVAPPMQGLRWRLDPGPTHLDTCTFQVLGDDGAVLQYRGFLDRGARLEARFSKRSIRIRGAVTFQMRDGESANMGAGYYQDMLPLNSKAGTTRFVMSKTNEHMWKMLNLNVDYRAL